MDVEHARTFIAVMETRNFMQAAEQLCVTQSTVSARIKTLETQLGRRLFTRSRAGVGLTAAGQRFSRHASTFLRIWGQARQEIALPENYIERLNIGAQISHWDDVMVNWLGWLRNRHPDIAVRAEVGSNDGLMRQMTDGTLDLAVVYTPAIHPGFTVEKLFEEKIVLVDTRRPPRAVKNTPPALGNGYVFVDWGPEFRTGHTLAWPDLQSPGLHFGVGTVALDFILRHGGSGYFPARLVRRAIRNRKLFRVRNAPTFARTVYLVTATDKLGTAIETILDGLRKIALAAEARNR
jgi:DNA-binding transcriptional LysR family regulator